MFGSSSRVRTEAELAEKLKQGVSEIFIEGSLTEKVIRILGVFIPPVFLVTGGGVGILNKLRKYEIVEESDSRLVLRKK